MIVGNVMKGCCVSQMQEPPGSRVATCWSEDGRKRQRWNKLVLYYCITLEQMSLISVVADLVHEVDVNIVSH